MANTALARRLQRLIEAFKRHGLRHVVEVFTQERVRRKYARSPIPLPSAIELKEHVNSATSSDTEFTAKLLQRAAQLLPLNGPDHSSRTDFLAALLATTPQETILRDAELIASGKFPALGLCIVEPSGKFSWHTDYGSGKEWPQIAFNNIRYLDGDGADVKYVWELSRMYWIAWLGKAYLLTQDERWAKEFKRLIDEWTAANPINVGVNWTVGMEVGIRAFWLVAGSAFFRGSPTLSPSWWSGYFALLWGHGTWVINNLEYFSNLTNHYIANCFGLVAVGALLEDSATGRAWFREGKERLEQELTRQVTPDGVHYERSIGYHGLVLEMYLIAVHLAEQVGNPFSPEALKRVEAMAEFTLHYTPPANATIPQLGDSDDGTILRTCADQELYDHRELLAIAGRLFKRNDMLAAAQNRTEQALLLFGVNWNRIGDQHPRTSEPPGTSSQLASRSFPEGGFVALRNQHFMVFADTGPIGLHGNNDTLSFTLHTADGTAWIVDPGTGCYTRNEVLRNTLRSTAAHNTPYIDETEIAEFAGLWRVREDRTQTRVIESQLSPNGEHSSHDNEKNPIRLAAEHYAYHQMNVVVRREWEIEGASLNVRDMLQGTGKHHVSIGFTIQPNIQLHQIDENTIALTAQKSTHKLLFSCSVPVSIVEGFYSPSYGIILPTKRIEIQHGVQFPLEIVYLCRLVSI